MTAGLLLAFVGLFAAGAQAQSTIILVSDLEPVWAASSGAIIGQPFTTGTNMDGYELKTVVVRQSNTSDVVTVAGHSGTDVSLSGSTLTFTTTNWDTARTVTAGKGTDTADDSATLTHTAASTDAGYGGIAAGSIAVTVQDNDTNAAPTFDEGTTAPNTGRPAIDSYDLEYREGSSGNWIGDPEDVADTYYCAREDADGTNPADISGTTSGTHTLTADDVGKKIKVKMSFTDGGGTDEGPQTSAAYPTGGSVLAAGICGRTQQVRDAILGRISGINDCADVTDAHLAAITGQLYIAYTGITTLQPGDFDGLTALEALWLDNNELTELPDGVFDGLTALEELWLNSNELTELPDGVFDGLTALTRLDLRGTELTELPDGVFDGLTALRWLFLSGNELTELPDGVFDGLTALRSLALGGNDLAELPDGVFDGLTALQVLTLIGNSLTELPDGVFDGLAALKGLWLNGNELTELPDGVFDGLAALEQLSLSRNELAELPDGVFNGLTALRSLYLGSNDWATELPDGVFGGLTALEQLYLNSNELTELPDGVFNGLTALEQLYLYGNELTELPDGVFDGLTALEELWLNDNELTELPDGVFDGLAALEGLRLNSNELTELPDGVFDDLAALEGLRLNSNELTELPDGVFDDLTALTWLDLGGNELTELPDGVFDGLAALGGLRLNSNELTELPDGVFDGLTALQVLTLMGNSLTELPDGVFDGLTALRVLALTGNSLTELPDGVFDGLTALTYLGLRGNPGPDGDIATNDFAPIAMAVAAPTTVPPAGGDVTLDGSASGGAWGTNVTHAWALNDPANGVTVTFDDAVAATTTVTIPALTAGTVLTFALTVTGRGEDSSVRPGITYTEIATATVTAVNSPAIGAPTISGTAQAGEELTAAKGTIADTDGTTKADNGDTGFAYNYQWAREDSDGTNPADIAGATSATYTLTDDDAGKKIKVMVSFTDDGGTDEGPLTSAAYPMGGTVLAATNGAPTFGEGAATTRSFAETVGDAVVATASAIGAGVTATDVDNDTLTYSLGGTDASKFTVVSTSGQIRTKAGESYDRETKSSYAVTARVVDGHGGADTIAVTINVTDATETPLAPSAPSATATPGSATGLDVSWTAPPNTGRPAIDSYDIEYREGSSGNWIGGPEDVAGTGAAIGSLAEDTAYEVRVRARNVDGDGAWSQPGSGSTGDAAVVDAPALVGLFPTASDEVRQGFVRVINHSAEAGEVTVAAIDDGGMRAGPVVLTLAGDATAHFNSDDLEAGNADKGLPDGVGPPGEGDWRLELASELDIEVLSYIRTEDGFLTAMHDVAPVVDGEHRVAIFNPAVNLDQVSRLRLINPTAEDAEATVTGVDDDGASPGTAIVIGLPAGESATLTATDLETGAGLDGALGDGAGKWRLAVASVQPIVVMSLLSSPTEHLTNPSTVPPGADDDGSHQVPLFPSASDPLGRQGFLRIVNRSADAGTVQVEAYDDSDVVYETVTVAIGVGRTVHFNSDDLELGNADKGLTGSTGAGTGDWRLALSSDDLDDIQVLAYIRHDDGFLTSMHDVAPGTEGASRVAIFNPGSNPDQVSNLRLVNPTAVDAEVTVAGIDDAGASPGTAVVLTVPAGASRTVDAATLEDGGEGIDGALGDGKGKWRLMVTSEQPIVVMSLMTSTTGQLTNLSTASDRDGT